jgi:DNA primase
MLDRELLAIPTAEYVRVLVGLVPNRAGKVLCPFHQETDPSLQLYPDGTFYCYGRHNKDRACRKGGTIFDFAAALWLSGQSADVPLRGRQFVEVRRRLLVMFLGEDAAA